MIELLAQYSFEHRLVLLVLAGYGALIIGGPRWLHHIILYDLPANLWKAFIFQAQARLNRPQRSRSVLRFRGRLLCLLLLTVVIAIGLALVAASVSSHWGWYLELAVVTYLLPIRAGIAPALELKQALQGKDADRARAVLEHLPTISEPYPTDAHTAIRAVCASMAENLPRHVIAPACYYLLLGLPALLAYRMLTTLLEMLPHHQHIDFTRFAYGLAKLLSVLPVQFGCLLLWLALAFVPKARMRKGLDAFQTYTKGALPVRLCAWGLHYTLGGASIHDSRGHVGQWIGEGKARLDRTDLNRVLLWYSIASGLWMLLITSALLLVSAY